MCHTLAGAPAGGGQRGRALHRGPGDGARGSGPRGPRHHALARHQRGARDGSALGSQQLALANRRKGRKRRAPDLLDELASGFVCRQERALLRRLQRVEVTDQIMTDRVMNELMGKDPSARFKFIMERAEEAEELDV